MADDELARAVNLPWAARLQEDVTELDLELREDARYRRPAVRWWWGERVLEGVNGALCYVCGELVVSWYRARPITREAIARILEHRDWHGAGGPDYAGGYMPARNAGVAAPPTEGQR